MYLKYITDRKTLDLEKILAFVKSGECAICKTGEEQLCRTKTSSIGVFRAGGYADHLLVPHPRYLFDIGNIPPEKAAPLACSGITTYGALKKVGAVLQQQPTVIIGAGGLGLMCLSLHNKMGGKGAIVVDIDARKREAAMAAGALATVDGKAPDALEQLQKAAGGPVRAVIDLVGSAQTTQLGFDALGKGGKLIIVGLFGGGPEPSVAAPAPPTAGVAGRHDEAKAEPRPEEQQKAAEPQKKKGFWGKVFGIFKGKKDKEDDREKDKDPL